MTWCYLLASSSACVALGYMYFIGLFRIDTAKKALNGHQDSFPHERVGSGHETR